MKINKTQILKKTFQNARRLIIAQVDKQSQNGRKTICETRWTSSIRPACQVAKKKYGPQLRNTDSNDNNDRHKLEQQFQLKRGKPLGTICDRLYRQEWYPRPKPSRERRRGGRGRERDEEAEIIGKKKSSTSVPCCESLYNQSSMCCEPSL